jgi:hypothetical protein
MPPKKGRKMVPKTEAGEAGAESKKKGKKKSKEKTGESCASCPLAKLCALYLAHNVRIEHRHVAIAGWRSTA